uniref:BAHD acyltransferase n=1 Tax=Erythroxylum coca TaxID=289672 RepID=H9N9G6_ERYCB|nr:BAHD acyltransferase [Erythroxylum coca]
MEVHIVSRETVKPSSPATLTKKPYKLSLFDQLTPGTYTPTIFFYPKNRPNSDTTQVLARLKRSLSETLDSYFFLSGRTRDNRFIDCFDEGVPFFEASVSVGLSDFLKHHEHEWLNRLVAYRPYTKEALDSPLLSIQVSVFACGGIVIGTSASHKLIDALTGSFILKTWAAMFRGDVSDGISPQIDEASMYFPTRDSFPQNHLSLMESLWFTEANYVTRRFVFGAKSISAIKEMAKSKPESKQSRIEALSCFIWKHCMSASKAVSGSPQVSILVEAVNLRTRTTPPMSSSSIGDLFWWATAASNNDDTKSTELPELANLLKEAIELYDTDFTKSLQGNEGDEAIYQYCEQLEGLFSLEKPDIFAFTSWCYVGFTKLNFGWGEPIWVGTVGKAGPAFRNLTVFIETRDGKGIEAWITLDQKRMSVLEHDPQFLAFASLNPKISSL